MDRGSWVSLGGVVSGSDCAQDLDSFVVLVRRDLERALVARFGLDDGVDAAATALAYAVEHWDRVAAMANPAGYLYRVGLSAGRRSFARRRRTGPLVGEPMTRDQPVDVDLQQALMRLAPDQRVAVVLVHGHGHRYADAARIMDVPITTVTNHLTRGLARLRRELEP